jgi:hypothetical protein
LSIERSEDQVPKKTSMSSIDVCVVGISVDDEQDVFHDFAGVFPHLFSGRKDEVGGTVLGMIFGQEMSI